jgi:hypothetical protein
MEVRRAGIFNNKLLHSLNTIQAAKTQLRLLMTSNSTPTVLVSQIDLCDILLGEIRTIRLSLEGRLAHRKSVRRSAGAAKRNRSHGHPIVQQDQPGKSFATRKIAGAACDDPKRVSTRKRRSDRATMEA